MYRTIVRDIYVILTFCSGELTSLLAVSCVESPWGLEGYMYDMGTEFGGGSCRVLQGFGMLHFESDVAERESVLLLGLWTWSSRVILGAVSLLPIDKRREAWGEGLMLWGVSGFRSTRC